MASHGSGHATLSSLKADIAVLTASGAEWSARIRRLAARAPGIDIFGNGYVLRGHEGWEITAAGRDFLAMIEAVTQDNMPKCEGSGPTASFETAAAGRGDLIVVGHRFRNRVHRPGATMRKARGVSVTNLQRGENASN